MPSALKFSDLYLYADDSCIVFQSNNIDIIKENLTKDFSELCDWFVDNKLSIHFGEDKTKFILFGTKIRLSRIENFNIHYKDIEIKRHSNVTYLGCILDQNLSGEFMATKVLSKIHSRLRFLQRKNDCLTPYLRRLLCNALIQPHFDYACSAWFPNLNKNLKHRLQTCQNKCIRFCLQMHSRSHLNSQSFNKINWLPVEDRVKQMICTTVHKYLNEKSPKYISDIFTPAKAFSNTRNSLLRLKQNRVKTNSGLNSIAFQGPKFWNTLPNEIKNCKSTNNFKHKWKAFYLKNLKLE